MSFSLTYRAAMTQLSQLAQPPQPAYVRVQVLTTLVRELSPGNPRHQAVARALAPNRNPRLPELPLTSAQRKQFHLHPLAADLAAPALTEDAPPPDDDDPEQEDDPWRSPLAPLFWPPFFSRPAKTRSPPPCSDPRANRNIRPASVPYPLKDATQ